jgi:hypothetical protein
MKLPIPQGEQRDRDQYAEQAAVEGHAAFPDLERVPGILCPVAKPVEQHVADPAAENDAEHGIEDQVVDVDRLPGRAWTPCAIAREPPGGREADEIHDPVPVHAHGAELVAEQSQRTELEGDRVEAGVMQHEAEIVAVSPFTRA